MNIAAVFWRNAAGGLRPMGPGEIPVLGPLGLVAVGGTVGRVPAIAGSGYGALTTVDLEKSAMRQTRSHDEGICRIG